MGRSEHRRKPQGVRICASVAVGIECVHAVVLGCHKHHIVRHPTNRYVLKIERLSIDVSVHSLREELAEMRRVHIRGIKDRLVEVLPRARDIVVPGSHTQLRMHQIAGRQKEPHSKNSSQAAAQFRQYPWRSTRN